MVSWFRKYDEIQCPDGTTKRVYRNPDKHFPLVARDWAARAAAAASTLDGIRANAEGEVARKLSVVHTQLDAANRNVQMSFRAVYMGVYASDPCTGYAILVNEVQQILSREDRNRQLLLHIEALETCLRAGGERATVDEIVNTLHELSTGSPLKLKTQKQIKHAREITEQWDES